MTWQTAAETNARAKQNYYEILEVAPFAHYIIIRYAYRFLAATYHPDNSDSGDAEKFKVLTEAWSVLSDSTKRQAYNAQLGVSQVVPPAAQESTAKASLSWSEVELRLAILQVLMEAKRKKPQTGGATAKMLMDCLNCQLADIEYVLWYLREKNYIVRGDNLFEITVAGVDYLVEQLSKTEPMNYGSSANLPVRR